MARARRLAIIGGGPGGLTLARILQTRGIAATVFEGERSADDRPQGGSLDLHDDTGRYALRLAGLEAEFERVARPEDQGFRLYDCLGALHFAEAGAAGEGDRPEVDRVALRGLLLDSLAPEVVRWGHRLRTIAVDDDGTTELIFTSGARERFDLVVGADGAWSRVRPLVSNHLPAYSGVTFVELTVDAVDDRHPAIAALVGRGKMFALGGGRALIGQRNGGGRVFVYAGLRIGEDWATSGAIDPAHPATARAALAGCFAGWAPELLALIDAAGDRIALRPLHALPIGHRWRHRAGVTLLGDAAHLMSPWGGEGANLAMRDAADLACALADADAHDWRAGIPAYEAMMADRAAVAARGAAAGLDTTFSDDGLEHALHHFQEHQAATP